MKTACIALKQFLFAGVVLAVGQLFKTTKIHAGELEARGLARPATAEELQAQAGIDQQDETDESKWGGDPAADSPPEDEDTEPEGSDKPEQEDEDTEPEGSDKPEQEDEDTEPEGSDKPEQEDEPDPASGDAESSEEPAAPVPKRRGRK